MKKVFALLLLVAIGCTRPLEPVCIPKPTVDILGVRINGTRVENSTEYTLSFRLMFESRYFVASASVNEAEVLLIDKIRSGEIKEPLPFTTKIVTYQSTVDSSISDEGVIKLFLCERELYSWNVQNIQSYLPAEKNNNKPKEYK